MRNIPTDGSFTYSYASGEQKVRNIFSCFGEDTKVTKGVVIVGRGEHFNHKRKRHPGNFPSNNIVERHTTEAQEDEELLVTQEAFKNRIEEEEQNLRG